ncbi:response regulator [uncultured Cohaesibacter sp.]|uniref:response regulator n=1 Tax=uncultured Cohaesibacter sp. TaxID=1002546 RepID=UPI00292D15D0|nr:response regulator [uncultured Cohaesibacter sp.]
MEKTPASSDKQPRRPISQLLSSLRRRLGGAFSSGDGKGAVQNQPEAPSTGKELKNRSEHKASQATLGKKNTKTDPLLSLGNLTILLVEDVDTIRASIRKMLDELGYKVIEASDGSEAIALVETHRPDVMLLDLSLPIMDGHKTAKWLRKHHDASIATLSIIAMSQHQPSATDLDERRLLFSGWLIKPFDGSTLEESIRSSMVSDAFVASEQPDPFLEEQWPILDPSVILHDLESLGAEQTLSQIDAFLHDAPDLSQGIHDATYTPDAATASQKAEKLKRAADNLGLLRLSQTALDIEKGNPPDGLERTLRTSIKHLSLLRSDIAAAQPSPPR